MSTAADRRYALLNGPHGVKFRNLCHWDARALAGRVLFLNRYASGQTRVPRKADDPRGFFIMLSVCAYLSSKPTHGTVAKYFPET